MSSLRLLEGVGLELEYMIVRRDSLDVFPIADRLIEAVAGEVVGEVELGDIAWSNELVLHVVEMKTNGPVDGLAGLNGLATRFAEHIERANTLLAGMGGCLMPTAAHPWMNPLQETRLWPHECGPIYQAYNRIFDCSGHGWSNLQSTHINLPFCGDAEFGRLHSAIRLLLPIMPALTASSPILDGLAGPDIDNRMRYYCNNSDRVPLVSGLVVPEPVYDEAAYHDQIFKPLYASIAPLDPEGLLQHEFLNARGAIARFDRGAIEIRVLDIQEAPVADIACSRLIIEVLQQMVATICSAQNSRASQWPTEQLADILQQVIRDGDKAVLEDSGYLALLGSLCPGRPLPKRLLAGELWQWLAENCVDVRAWDDQTRDALGQLLRRGVLGRSVLEAIGKDFSRERLAAVYGGLCQCLAENRIFLPDIVA